MAQEKDKTWSMNQIEDEHIRIRATISMIKSMLLMLQSTAPAEVHYKKLNACLQKFYFEIKSHFMSEESRGALIEIREDYPEVMEAQVKFNKEHREFLKRIQEMRDAVNDLDPNDKMRFLEIMKEFESFCDDVIDHDQRETEAFQAVFYCDQGIID